MSRIELKSRTVRYFLEQYQRSNLLSAVEVAAKKERKETLPNMSDFSDLPIDVEEIARRRNIHFTDEKFKNLDNEAKLFATEGGYYLKESEVETLSRRRFAIAHEIGHTLFLNGFHHVIGTLGKVEFEAEEYICNLFASALLMPEAPIKDIFRKINIDNPQSIFHAIEYGVKRLKVSVTAFIWRLGRVNFTSIKPFIILDLKFLANDRTGLNPCLRVHALASLESLKKTKVWFNKPAKKFNLCSAEDLFSKWKYNSEKSELPLAGRYTLVNDKIEKATENNLKWESEELSVGLLKNGKWTNEKLTMKVCNCLYSKKGLSVKDVHVISLLKP